jgi:hypothetical protein
MRFPNYPSLLNRKKSFSIKEFMNKGNGNGDSAGSGLPKIGETSPKMAVSEFVAHNFVEVNARLRSPGKHKTVQSTSPKVDPLTLKGKSPSVSAYSIAFNPLMLFDPTFILIGVGVFLVAIRFYLLCSCH